MPAIVLSGECEGFRWCGRRHRQNTAFVMTIYVCIECASTDSVFIVPLSCFIHALLFGFHIVRMDYNPCVFSILLRDVVCANATSTWLNNWSAVEHCLILKMMQRQTREKRTDTSSQQISFESFYRCEWFYYPLLIVMLIMRMMLLLILIFGMCHATYIIGAKWLFFGQFAYCDVLDNLFFRRNFLK